VYPHLGASEGVGERRFFHKVCVKSSQTYHEKIANMQHNVSTLLFFFPGRFLLVMGGWTHNGLTADVEVISLDPKNYPLPDRLGSLEKMPRKMQHGGGALLTTG
jgi:hypothetical protein